MSPELILKIIEQQIKLKQKPIRINIQPDIELEHEQSSGNNIKSTGGVYKLKIRGFLTD